MTDSLRIATVLKSGGDYDEDYVERINSALDCYAPGVPRVCFSDVEVPGADRIPLDYGWPGWWSKMELFRPEVRGDLLYMDLDTMPVASLTPLISQCNGHTIALRDFYHKDRIGSGLMYLPEAMRARIWARFMRNPESNIREYSKRTVARWGDQAFLFDNFAEQPLRWQDVVPGAVVSYKAHVQRSGSVPAGTSIVCFHGKPRPRDIGWRLPDRPPQQPQAVPDLGRWRGATVFLIGGGPSASAFDFERIRGRGLVVAINDAAVRLPWADVMFTADMSYVLRRRNIIRQFFGTKILAAPVGFPLPAGVGIVERVNRLAVGATSSDPMTTVTGNSGFSALILAAARGAARIVLIGFDMAGPGHWFGEYEWKCRLGVEQYPDWIAQMEAVGGWLRSRGCDVVNLNPDSAIRCFRFASLDEVLS